MKSPTPNVVDLTSFKSSRTPTPRPATPRFLPSAAKTRRRQARQGRLAGRAHGLVRQKLAEVSSR
jgi:hypothetical protein